MGRGRRGRRAADVQLQVELPPPLDLPFECIVEGVPATLQSSTDRRRDWRKIVRDALKAKKPAKTAPLPFGSELRIRIAYYYVIENPWETVDRDIDNIVKPILDAGKRIVYSDDSQVMEVCSERHRIGSVQGGSPMVVDALGAGFEFVHITFLPL